MSFLLPIEQEWSLDYWIVVVVVESTLDLALSWSPFELFRLSLPLVWWTMIMMMIIPVARTVHLQLLEKDLGQPFERDLQRPMD